MVDSKTGRFLIIFSIIVISDILVLTYEEIGHFRIITKPMIVGSLLMYVLLNGLVSKKRNLIFVFALIFSLLGDVLLLFEARSELYFIGGLISFLIAHLCYSVFFYKHRDTSKNPLVFSFLVAALAGAIFYFIMDGLHELKTPVIIYMIVIILMVTLAYIRKGGLKYRSYLMVLMGAVFFLISDSLLAISKFRSPFIADDQSIIITYAIAQYLIVFGILKMTLSSSTLND